MHYWTLVSEDNKEKWEFALKIRIYLTRIFVKQVTKIHMDIIDFFLTISEAKEIRSLRNQQRLEWFLHSSLMILNGFRM